MARIDVYLRSIERFGAAGAILTSGQAVTLRFPTGDRHATQVTHHDALVALVREIAPPIALDMIDRNQPSSFDIDSGNIELHAERHAAARPWQVAIEPANAAGAGARARAEAGAGSRPAATSAQPQQRVQRAQTERHAAAGEPADRARPVPVPGGPLDDERQRAARSADAGGPAGEGGRRAARDGNGRPRCASSGELAAGRRSHRARRRDDLPRDRHRGAGRCARAVDRDRGRDVHVWRWRRSCARHTDVGPPRTGCGAATACRRTAGDRPARHRPRGQRMARASAGWC